MRLAIDMAVIAALIWIFSADARADDRCTWAVATVASHHLDDSRPRDYEQRNWGLGVEHCLGKALGMDARAVSGIYRNSNRINSVYVGGSFQVLALGPLKLGIAAVAVSGYEVEPIPAAFPVLFIEGSRMGINLAYFPKTSDNVAALGLQAKWRWR